MNRKFIPRECEQDKFIKKISLRQGTSSVEEYTREFKKLSLICDIQERKEQTCARFLGGLNFNIRDKVEVSLYDSLEDMIKLAMKFEKQLKKNKAISKPISSISHDITSTSNTSIEDKKLLPHEERKRDKVVKDMHKQCYKCKSYGHFAIECPNKCILTLKEIEVARKEEKKEEVKDYSSDGWQSEDGGCPIIFEEKG